MLVRFAEYDAESYRREVLEYFRKKAKKSEVGLALTDEICDDICIDPDPLSDQARSKLQSIVMYLVEEGHLYTTIDEMHYAATP